MFWILQKYPNITHAIINDINSDLINTYNIIKHSPEDLIDCLQVIQREYLSLTEEGRKEYYLSKRDTYNQLNKKSPLSQAALFIFLNRTCYNGLYRVNSNGLFNVPFGRYHNPTICDSATILADSKILQNVVIMCGDFSETLQYATSDALFYFDPPYKSINSDLSFNSYSAFKFNDDDQIRLRDFCTQVSGKGSSFILSNSDLKNTQPDNDFFDTIYEKFNIKRVSAHRMINSNSSKRGKIYELMVSNC